MVECLRNPLLILESVLGMDGYLKRDKLNYYSVGDWFLGAIIIIYVLFPLMLYVYKKYKWQITAFIVVTFMIMEMTGFINTVSRSNILICCSSFWMGMLVGEYSWYLKKHKYPLIISLFIIAFLCTVDIKQNMSEVLILEIFGIVAYIFLYYFPVEKIKEDSIMRKTILFMSKYSYAVMLTHHVLVYWGIHFFEKLGLNLNLCLFVTVAGIYVMSFLLSNINDKFIRKLHIIVGGKKCKVVN